MSTSKNIPVRMPLELYEAVISSKPADIRVSTYLLLLVRRGLNAGVDGLSTNVETTIGSVDSSRNIVDNILISALQSRIAGLESQLEGVQRIVDDADSIRSEATKALENIEATVDFAVQKAVDNCTVFVDRRIQEGINQRMAEVLGECRA